MGKHVLAIDQGTTSTRSLVFGPDRRVIATAQREFAQHYPADGWVEHDPEDIWRDTLETARGALAQAGLGADDIAAIGITNQRETVLAWNRRTGVPYGTAIVWQDRRTAARCDQLAADGHLARVRDITGLVLDPYFSAPKMAWIRRNLTDAGVVTTTDTWLVNRLCGAFVTDAATASRSLLTELDTSRWNDELLTLFGLADEAFVGGAVGLLHRSGGTLLAQEVDGGVQVALGLVQGLLAVHQSGAGHGAELPDKGWCDLRHEEYRLRVVCCVKTRRSVIRYGAFEREV